MVYDSKMVWTSITFSPPITGLWGWFKHNEGAGAIIIDYSPIAVNGTLNGSAAIFWSVAGFGHNAPGGTNSYVSRATTATSSKYNSMCGFIKPLGATTEPWDLASAAQWNGEGGATTNFLKYGWEIAAPNRWAITSGNAPSVYYALTSPTFNTWYFILARSGYSGVNAFTQLYVRASGGSLTQVINQANANAYTSNQTSIFSFDANSNPYNMNGGDMMYWMGSDAASFISVAEANYIYNNLKSRYGMS